MQRTKFLAVICYMMLAAGSVFAQKHVPEQSLDQSYQQASDLFRKEKYASAQQQFDLLARDKRADGTTYQSDAVYYAAVCSQQLGNEDALYRLEEFLRLYPESPKVNMAHYAQGNYHYGRSEYSLALKYYSQVASSDIEYGSKDEYFFRKGYCYVTLGDNEKAKSCFSQVKDSKRSKYYSGSIYYYAHIQYKEGNYEQALKDFEKLKRDKSSAKYFAKVLPNYYAHIYYYLGMDDNLIQMAKEIDESNEIFRKGELQQMIAEVYFNRGDSYAQAIEYYRKAEQSYAEERNGEPAAQGCVENDYSYQLGYSYLKQKQYDSAIVYLSRKSMCDDSIAQNAMYCLGLAYLKKEMKSEARSMFLQASQMNYDAKVKENALYNFAMLSIDMNMNPYNESIRSLTEYMEKYPRSRHKEDVQKKLTELYCTTRNFKDALTLMEGIQPKSLDLKRAYMRLLVNRGVELMNERNLQAAARTFKTAIDSNYYPVATTDAYALYGECRYRLGDLKEAKRSLDKFFVSNNAKGSAHYTQALYTYAYLCMDRDSYVDAEKYYRQFLERDGVPQNQKYDAHNRLGDCLYMQKKFEGAISEYNLVIAANATDADYATYQKSLCYGAMGKHEEKLTYLNYIFEHYKNSTLASKAQLEIANTYLVLENNEMALRYFENFTKRYATNSHVKEALLNMGLIYYNTSRDAEALSCFDQLLTKYQGTDEARDALLIVKNIYVAQNRVDDYFTYVKNTTHIRVSSSEQDSITFMAAANRYYENDYENAASGLEKYLQRYGHGLFYLKANYYLADSYYNLGAHAQANKYYQAVVAMNKNQYTEVSLQRAAEICREQNELQKAVEMNVQLIAMAESDIVRVKARMDLVRCYDALRMHRNVVAAAEALLAEPKATTEQKEEALVCEARSYYRNEQYDSADMVYYKLQHSSNGEYQGEALYTHAEILYALKEYNKAEKAIETISSNPPSDYWLAKSFILWADIFHARGNSMQAKQTLQSIIDNYDGEELVRLAVQKRNAILAEEGVSMPADQPDQEIVIEIDDDLELIPEGM